MNVPSEDSPDFTDEESSAAVPTDCVETLIAALRVLTCEHCLQPVGIDSHAFRRRAPHVYSRVSLRCPAQHTMTRVFQVDWVHGSS